MHHVHSLEPRRLFAGGTTDPTFGGNGAIAVRVPLPAAMTVTNNDSTKPIKLLPDAVGRTVYVAANNDGLTLGRLTAAGQVDPTFAGGQLSIAVPASSAATDVTLDSAGGIDVLAEGTLRRFTPSGRLDRTFATDGTFSLTRADLRGRRRFAVIEAIAPDSQGRLVGLATAYNRNGRQAIDKLSVVFRLTAAGTLDSGFGTGGTVTLDAGDARKRLGTSGAIRLLADGSILVALTSDDALVTFKLTSAGKVDSAYGTDGRGVFEPGIGDLSLYGIRADGRIDAVGVRATSGQKAAGNRPAALDDNGTARLAADGKSGRLIGGENGFGPEDMEPLAVEADGSKWVYDRPFSVSPARALEDQGVLYRLRADGSRDRAFNRSGELVGATAAVAADGTILVAVQTGGPDARATGRITVARYFPDEGPLAFSAPAALARASTDVSFSLLWRDDDPIDVSTLDDNDVVLTKGSTRLTARVVRTNVLADGRLRVTYAAAGPGGTWDRADNGTYAIATKANAVKDTVGVGNTGRSISTLAVAIA